VRYCEFLTHGGIAAEPAVAADEAALHSVSIEISRVRLRS
jgi:hypothetical protein